jgi:hypothetical protein
VLPIPESVVIAGLNIEGLITALALHNYYKKNNLRITIIGEQDNNQNKRVIVATKQLTELLSQFDLAEVDWMPKSYANYKLTRHFVDWSQNAFFIPNKSEVDSLNEPLMFELSKIRRQNFDIPFDIDKFFFCNALAAKNLSPRGKDFPFDIDYQYQMDTESLFTILFELAIKNGISIPKLSLSSLVRDKQGNITSVDAGDQVFCADYFFDCTNMQQLLISNMIGHGNENTGMIRNNDRYLQLVTDEGCVSTQTTSFATPNGWINKNASLKHVEYRHYFSSQFCTDEQALEEFSAFIHKHNLPTDAQINLVASADHIAKQPWIKNCIAIGASSGANHITQDYELSACFSSLDSFFLSVQQDKAITEAIEQFNSRVKTYHIFLHAFAHTLVLLNNRRDTAYWQTPKDIKNIHPLVQNIFMQWLRAEDLTTDPVFDSVGVNAWYCLFSGLEHYPFDDLQKHSNHKSIVDNIEDVKSKLDGCCLNFPAAREAS